MTPVIIKKLIDRKYFFERFRLANFLTKITQVQVDSLNALLDAWEKFKDTDLRRLAYLLGTTYHETAHTMLPVTEIGNDKYLKSKKYWPHIGRGYTQLTWLSNYVKYSKILGIDLVANPARANEPAIAAYIIVHGMITGGFTGVGFNKYFGVDADWLHARQIINCMDKAALIVTYSKRFLQTLRYAA